MMMGKSIRLGGKKKSANKDECKKDEIRTASSFNFERPASRRASTTTLPRVEMASANVQYLPMAAKSQVSPVGVKAPVRRSSQSIWMTAFAPGNCFAGGPAI